MVVYWIESDSHCYYSNLDDDPWNSTPCHGSNRHSNFYGSYGAWKKIKKMLVRKTCLRNVASITEDLSKHTVVGKQITFLTVYMS